MSAMMKIYPSWFIFMTMNITGLLMIFSSTNWLMTWMGFELSLLGFLPLFLANKLAIESMVKYLLIQAGGSSMFLISFMSKMKILPTTMVMLSMFMKMGMFPFTQWVPVIMSTLSWNGCLLLTTLQKLGPIFVLMKLTPSSTFPILLSGSMSILISGLMGINQTKMRPILGYSSISHSGWIMVSITVNQNLSLTYMLIYIWMSVILFNNLKSTNMTKLMSSKSEKKESFNTLMSLMILSGLPPFSMFFLKMMILLNITNHVIIMMMMITGAMMSTYFYLTNIIPSLIKNWQNIISKKKHYLPKSFTLPMIAIPLTMIL